MISKMIKSDNRMLGILLFSPLIILVIVGGGLLKYGLLIISIIAIMEFYHAFTNRNINGNLFLGILFNTIYYVFLLGKSVSDRYLVLIFTLFLMICLCYTLFNRKSNIMDGFVTFMPLMYVSVPCSLIYLINMMEHGNILVWLPLITCWSCDSVAYFSGRFFGKTKLCESISPKKTVEGAIGGVIGSVLISLIFGIMFSATLNIKLIHFLIMGIIAGIVGQMGDLIASSIKRYNGIKDFGHIMPGHGGILDRFDSVLLNNVAIFFYLNIIMNL